MLVMYVSLSAPVVGGLVRSGMGTRLARVLAVQPSTSGHSWVCHVMPLGSVKAKHARPLPKGRAPYVYLGRGWVPYGPRGSKARTLTVYTHSRYGWHPVGPVAPPLGAPY